MNDKIIAYVDGSCISNGEKDAKGGWATKMMYKGYTKVKSGHESGTTNNRMEITALLETLKSIKNKSIPVEIYSDSKYVIETMLGKYSVGANEDLWKKVFTERDKFKQIDYSWVKGHSGDANNDEVDKLARAEAYKA